MAALMAALTAAWMAERLLGRMVEHRWRLAVKGGRGRVSWLEAASAHCEGERRLGQAQHPRVLPPGWALHPASAAAMAPSIAIATVLVLPDREPLAPRLEAALSRLAPPLLEGLEQQLAALGRALVFRGTPVEAGRIAARLRSAGLTTSVNLLHTEPAVAPRASLPPALDRGEAPWRPPSAPEA